jgi:hypothetical protein
VWRSPEYCWSGWSPSRLASRMPARPGTAYYVDAAGGDDSAAGTAPAAAWRTLDEVNATTFRPGDRILLFGRAAPDAAAKAFISELRGEIDSA